jgi:predicted nuclease of predicted toxin-antitoxin system
VKFLVDNQLPAGLAVFLSKKGMDCEHVLDIGLAEAKDAAVCKYAFENERIIISKDEDFPYLASRPRVKLQFVWIRLAIAGRRRCSKPLSTSGRRLKPR